MYQAVFFDAYIDESAEIGDVAHDARQFHANAKVVNRTHVLVELEYLDRPAWVASRFFQFLQNIFQGGHPDGGREVSFRLYLQSQLFVGY